jgi:hypothetical protein
MTFDKEAQRKSIVNMLGRHLNPMELARKTLSRRYRDVYNKIKEIDNDMREVALSSDPGIRDSLHEARMAYKNREYPRVLFYAWKILETMDGIFYQIDELEKLRETMMEEFYGEGTKLSDDELRQMNEALGKKPEKPLAQGPVQMPKAAKLELLLYAAAAPDPDSIPMGMVKQAGPMQWLQENIPTFHQMEGALLDRIFRNKMGKQREAAKSALNIAERAHASIKEVFKQLDAARTDFSSYITIAKRFKDRFEQQKQQLSALYQSNFADIVPDMSKYNKDKGNQTPAAPVAPAAPAAPEMPPAPEAPAPAATAPAVTAPIAPEVSTTPEPSTALMEPAAPQQLELDVDEESPKTLTSAEFQDWRNQNPQLTGAAALQVISLWKNAETEILKGNNGVAAALLVKASEICDDYDAINGAKAFLLTAEKVLKG